MKVLEGEIRNLLQIDLTDTNSVRLIKEGSIAKTYELKNLSKKVAFKIIPDIELNHELINYEYEATKYLAD